MTVALFVVLFVIMAFLVNGPSLPPDTDDEEVR